MKPILACIAALLLASCVSNDNAARFVLSEPNDTASLSTLGLNHELHITENRMLVHNGEEKFQVPDGKLVVFEMAGTDEPVFTLMEKSGKHFNWNVDF